MAQTTTPQQRPIAEILAEARLSLDAALQRAQAGEPLGTLSETTRARLAADSPNTGCNNTSCGHSPRAAAQGS